MLSAKLLGGSLPSWLWMQLGSALGLMSGAVDGGGKAVGHSGDSPFDVKPAIYFPDVPDAITIAASQIALIRGRRVRSSKNYQWAKTARSARQILTQRAAKVCFPS